MVFRSFDDNFVAFDMACPYEIKRDVRVAVDMSGVAVCSVCGSKFDVGYGTGMPSRRNLQNIRCGVTKYIRNGTDKLRIYQ